MPQLLLGQASNGQSTDIGINRRGKRQRWGVNDSTYLAKDLVSSGTHITPASQTHVFVVSTTHSNIPATLQTDQKLSKNQTTKQYAAMIVKLPAKCSASSPLQVKALNDKSPTIVTPIITVQLDGAGEKVTPLECLTPPPLTKQLHRVPALLGDMRE